MHRRGDGRLPGETHSAGRTGRRFARISNPTAKIRAQARASAKRDLSQSHGTADRAENMCASRGPSPAAKPAISHGSVGSFGVAIREIRAVWDRLQMDFRAHRSEAEVPRRAKCRFERICRSGRLAVPWPPATAVRARRGRRRRGGGRFEKRQRACQVRGSDRVHAWFCDDAASARFPRAAQPRG